MSDQYSDPDGPYGAPPPAPGSYQPYPQPAPGYGPPPASYAAPGGVQLPAGVELASAGVRVGAYFLSGLLGLVTLGIGYVIWSFVLYGKGTTPAFKLLGLRCYHLQRRAPADWGAMALREIVGNVIILGFVPFASIVSFVLFLARSERRGIPDLVSGTIVVRDPQRVLGPF